LKNEILLKKQGRFFKIIYGKKQFWLPLYFYRSLRDVLTQSVPLKELEKMIFSLLKERVLFFIGLRDRSEYEIKSYLKRLRQERFERKTLKYLKRLGLLNDRIFGIKFLSYQKSRSLGPYAVKKTMLQKGLKNSLVEEILEKGYTLKEEEQLAKKLAKKYVSFKPIKEKKDLVRLINFLKNKGFHNSVIYQIISIYGNNFF